MQKKRNVRNQHGFTLVEVIAVLVILGILAAVLIPKYFDLTASAKDKALDSALAEGVARVNQYYAQQIIDGFAPQDIWGGEGDINDHIGTDLGDFRLTTEAEGFRLTFIGGYSGFISVAQASELTLQAEGKAGTPVADCSKTKVIPMPGLTGGGPPIFEGTPADPSTRDEWLYWCGQSEACQQWLAGLY